ncbi:2-oxoglutarate ferredoxin oxidoreductase, gamma subunit [Dethiosulfatibacter aminovorans DSM 17477]|uniref:2-oxoglutarate ferredoxin oxidoreductase, gamma subunit n=1 Tax=Dethiosulfatibacter aminovorans DSM 17477 TaxID=1121476 RepID=A0A1M6DAY8_9FIRM|nr:2-oxoacid:acceptor oxidoreductase family protein [Dethiosulfatibacter aminovorans]SHI70325.1 2-oxoglutarate ferredoxin oxidoreductase, gamma subunit [Dethiosulfatibacter aminovorans DSM 17477]
MSKKYEIRLSGSGGQGLILAGIILADASLIQGINGVQSQSYGPEARGGASKAEVIISTEEINYPKVQQCDLLLCLTQKSYDEYIASLKNDGILVIDDSIDNHFATDAKIYKLPILKTAIEEMKKPMVANIVSLGAISNILDILDEKNILSAVLKRVPPGTENVNKEAFSKGVSLL